MQYCSFMQSRSLTSDSSYQDIKAPAAILLSFFIAAAAVAYNALALHGPAEATRRNAKKTIQALINRTRKGSLSKYRRAVHSVSPRALTKHIQGRLASIAGYGIYYPSNHANISQPSPLDGTQQTRDKDWREAACQWLRWDPNPETRTVVTKWLKTGDDKTATK